MQEFKSFYKDVKGNEGSKCHYSTRLDTYGCGCQHDCNYCYAKSLLDFRGLWNAQNPSVADAEKIAKKVKKLEAGKVIRLGGMTDCFAPIERAQSHIQDNTGVKREETAVFDCYKVRYSGGY